MAGNHRYWCGECGYHTSWITESEGADRQIEHYARRHPDVEPGGWVEFRKDRGNGVGCLGIVGILFLLLLLASTCQSQKRSASAIDPVAPATARRHWENQP
jgi:hypothetical protein